MAATFFLWLDNVMSWIFYSLGYDCLHLSVSVYVLKSPYPLEKILYSISLYLMYFTHNLVKKFLISECLLELLESSQVNIDRWTFDGSGTFQ